MLKTLIKKNTLLILIFINLVLFQNCQIKNGLDLSSFFAVNKNQASIGIQTLDSSTQMINHGGGGNGDGYEGKPDGPYVRWIPDHTCEGEKTQYSEIVLNSKDKSIQLVTNELALCKARSQENIAISELEFSFFDPKIVTYKDGIYIHKDKNKKLEVLCQSDQFQLNIYLTDENLSEINSQRVAEIYFKDTAINNYKKIFSIPLLHSVIQKNNFDKKLEYKMDAINFETNPLLSQFQLVIDAKKSDFKNGYQYSSVINSNSSQKNLNLNEYKLNCKIAAGYDGVIWPSKILVQGKQVHDYELIRKNNWDLGFVLTANNIQNSDQKISPKKLYFLDFQDDSLKNLVTDFPENSKGVDKFIITKDQENIVYSAIENILGFSDLFHISMDLKYKHKISSDRSFSGYGVLNNFQQDPNSGRIVFMESSNQTGIPQTMFYIRTNTLDGSSMQKVISETGDLNEQTRSFWIDSVLQKIFFYTGFTNVQLNKFDPITQELNRGVDQTVLQNLSQVQAFYNVLKQSDINYKSISSNYILMVVQPGITSSQKKLIRTKKDGSEPIDLGPFESVKAFSSDGSKIILETKYELISQYKYINLDDLSGVILPNAQMYFFNLYNNGIYYINTMKNTTNDNKLNLNYFNLDSKNSYTVKTISSAQLTTLRNIKWMKQGQYLVYMMDSDLDGKEELYMLDVLHSESDIQQINDRYFDYGGVQDFKIINDNSIVYSTKPLNEISPSLFIYSNL